MASVQGRGKMVYKLTVLEMMDQAEKLCPPPKLPIVEALEELMSVPVARNEEDLTTKVWSSLPSLPLIRSLPVHISVFLQDDALRTCVYFCMHAVRACVFPLQR